MKSVLFAVLLGAALAHPNQMKCIDYSTQPGMTSKVAAEDSTAAFTLTVTGTGAATKLAVAGIPAGNKGAIVWVTGGELKASVGFTAVANCKTALHVTQEAEITTASINWDATNAAGKKICVAHASSYEQLKMKCAGNTASVPTNAPVPTKCGSDTDPQYQACQTPFATCMTNLGFQPSKNMTADQTKKYCTCVPPMLTCLKGINCDKDATYTLKAKLCENVSPSAAPVLQSSRFVSLCAFFVSIAAVLQL